MKWHLEEHLKEHSLILKLMVRRLTIGDFRKSLVEIRDLLMFYCHISSLCPKDVTLKPRVPHGSVSLHLHSHKEHRGFKSGLLVLKYHINICFHSLLLNSLLH